MKLNTKVSYPSHLKGQDSKRIEKDSELVDICKESLEYIQRMVIQGFNPELETKLKQILSKEEKKGELQCQDHNQ